MSGDRKIEAGELKRTTGSIPSGTPPSCWPARNWPDSHQAVPSAGDAATGHLSRQAVQARTPSRRTVAAPTMTPHSTPYWRIDVSNQSLLKSMALLLGARAGIAARADYFPAIGAASVTDTHLSANVLGHSLAGRTTHDHLIGLGTEDY